MGRLKRMAGALMITAALLNIAPAASAAEPAEHCFIIDHPAVCLVICTAQNQSVKACNVAWDCNADLVPTVCFVLGEVWDLVP